MGRDTLTRLLHGARLSLFVGFFVVLVSATLGLTLGLISGYYGGKVDKLIMRSMDILMALPSILLAIVIVSILGARPCECCFSSGNRFGSFFYKDCSRRCD